MASAAFPDVIAALYATTTAALEPVRVVRGRDISDDPEDLVMIGVAQSDEADEESAGDFTQEMMTFAFRQETGTVNGLVIAWNGDGDQAAATATAFGYLASIEAALRADVTLGLSQFESMVAQLQAGGEVAESQNSEGARTSVPFAVGYVAVI